ncbi:acyl-CoA dehydrogenase family protein [Nocardia sp. NPDC004340]
MTITEFARDSDHWVSQAREFAERVLEPHTRDHDRTGRLHASVLPELGRAGFLGLGIDTEFGGAGASSATVGAILEVLARVDMSPCYAVLNCALVGSILAENGSPEQRSRWLPSIAAGRVVPALCLTEEDAGTDAAAISFRAERVGEGWVLTGRKTSIMLAGYATHALVLARTGEPGARGVSAFFVDLSAGEVRREVFEDLGCRAGGRGSLEFVRFEAGAAELVGAENRGFVEVMRGFGYSRALICMMAVGAAQAALDAAVNYARERIAFGKPISAHQGVAFPLVDAQTTVAAARLLTMDALDRRDSGRDYTAATNMAKAWVPRVCFEAAHRALLTCGHRGWNSAADFERRLRDLVGPEIADGTENAARLVVARQLFGRSFAP